MNITLLCIGVILAVIAVIVFGVKLNESSSTDYISVDIQKKPTETIKDKQAELQAYINQMPHPKHRYGLNPEERDLIASVIEAEAGGEDWTGKVLIAQCLLNACEKDGIRPIQAVRIYQYATTRPDPSELSYAAVRYVFDDGEVATEQPVLYFYAPARCQSSWHESQRYLFEHGGHRFFATKED